MPRWNDVAPVKRRRMTPKRARAIWERHHGVCYLCSFPVPWGEHEIEHPIALANGGDDDDDRLRPVHAACHKEKTREDRRISAKINRLRAREDGTRRERKAIPSRGFAPGKRKMPSRPFSKRP